MFWKNKKIGDIITECEEIDSNLIKHTACFTGHRSQKLPWKSNEQDRRYKETRQETKEKIKVAISKGYTYFMSGMALGFDTMATELVLELKKEFSNIKIVGVLPCKEQDKKWNDADKKRYHSLLKKLDRTICLSEEYTPTCMLDRNDYMLKNSSMVIALFNGLPGGTQSTISKAKKQGKEVIIIEPKK